MELLRVAAHAHEVMHLIVEGIEKAPETAARVKEVFEKFSEEARPILQAQLRADLLTTPPDDRDAEWRELFNVTEEEN